MIEQSNLAPPELWNRARRYLDGAPKFLAQTKRNLQRFARNQPLAASVAALATGLLVARVLSRR
jgi:hypothetical protein